MKRLRLESRVATTPAMPSLTALRMLSCADRRLSREMLAGRLQVLQEHEFHQ